jgi:hypothetical protein
LKLASCPPSATFFVNPPLEREISSNDSLRETKIRCIFAFWNSFALFPFPSIFPCL